MKNSHKSVNDSSLSIYWRNYGRFLLENNSHLFISDITKTYLYYALFRVWQTMLKSNTFSVLELGSGSGLGLKFLADRCNLDCVGIERNFDAFKLARKISSGSKKLSFHQKDFNSFKLKRLFDVVFSIGVVEHYDAKEVGEIIHKHLDSTKCIACILIPNESRDSIYWEFLKDSVANNGLRYPEKNISSFNVLRNIAERTLNMGVSTEYLMMYSVALGFRKRVEEVFKDKSDNIRKFFDSPDPNYFDQLFNIEKGLPLKVRKKHSFFQMLMIKKRTI